MTSGISKAVGTLVEGGFKGLAKGSLSKAAEVATKGFADAFTGKAGAAGVQAGVNMATDFAIKEAAGQGLFDQTVNKIMGDVGGSTLGEETVKGSLNDVNATIEQNMIDLNPNISDAAKMEQAFNTTQAGVNQATDFSVDSLTESVTTKVAPQSMETTAGNIIGNETSRSLAAANTSLLDKAGSVAKSLLSGTSDMGSSYMPIQAVGAGSLQRGNVSARGGAGSSGGNFLSESMLRAVQKQQQTMARGFG
jgi:translation elongation factor EF-Ts